MENKYGEQGPDLLNLNEKQEERLSKSVCSDLQEWKDGWKPVEDELDRKNARLEGLVQSVDFPFQGSSNLHVPIDLIYLKVFHTIQRRSILGSGRIWYLVSPDIKIQEQIADIDEGVNYRAFHDWNTAETLNDVFWTTPRDGLTAIFVSYRMDTELVSDVIEATSADEFLAEFPTPDDAGMDKGSFIRTVQKCSEATPDSPVSIPVERERVTYCGPWCDLVELANFVVLPIGAPSLDRRRCSGYGRRYFVRASEVRRLRDEGYFFEDKADLLLSKKPSSQLPQFERTKREVAGIYNSENKTEYELFDLVYRHRLDKGSPESLLILTVSLERKIILGVRTYDLPEKNCVLFYSERRPNQLVGGNVPTQLDHLIEEIDSIHNMRINSRMIAQVPSFIAKPSLKGQFDPALSQNWFRPGVIFWIENSQDVRQFEIKGLDLNAALLEEDRSMKLCSLVTGVDPFTFSGNPQPDNPDAPGNKTLYLISQSNLRMDDVLAAMAPGIEELGKVLVAFERRYGSQDFTYSRENWKGGMDEVSFSRSLLNSDKIKFSMAGTNVALNPESELTRWFGLGRQLMEVEPLFASDPKRRIAMWRQALTMGRVPGKNLFLPSMQELDEQEKMMLAQAQGVAQRQAGLGQMSGEIQKKEQLLARLQAATGQLPEQGALSNADTATP